MTKKIGYDIIFLIFVVVSLTIISYNSFEQKHNFVCFEKNCFEVELAITQKEQEKGLTGREYLDNDKGMLYFFGKEDLYNFWMKDTLIYLDIIWIDKKGNIVDFMNNAAPCKGPICFDIKTDKKAKYVLEVNGGTIYRLGLKVGDKLKIDLIDKNFEPA